MAQRIQRSMHAGGDYSNLSDTAHAIEALAECVSRAAARVRDPGERA